MCHVTYILQCVAQFLTGYHYPANLKIISIFALCCHLKQRLFRRRIEQVHQVATATSRLVKRVCGNTMLTINNKMQIYQACVLSTLFKNTRHHLARHCSQQGRFGKRRFAMYVSPAHPMPATMIGPYQKNGQQPNPQERALRLGTRGVASGTRPVANGT